MFNSYSRLLVLDAKCVTEEEEEEAGNVREDCGDTHTREREREAAENREKGEEL